MGKTVAQFWRNLLTMRREREYDVACMFGDRVFFWNFEDAWREYAEQTGREPLSKEEKQIALLNHVISKAEKCGAVT